MRKWNKLLALLLAMVMALGLTVTGFAADAEDVEGEAPAAFEVPEDAEGSIVILHTNDVHGAVESYAKVATLKAMYEEAGAYVLLLDAGDFSQGAAAVNVHQGATAVELMNMAGYDAAAPGNHEFDYGYENLTKLVEAAGFPILAANVTYEGEPAFEASVTFETEDGTKIGVFGLDTPEAKTKTNPAKTVGVEFASGEEMYKAAQEQVDALTEAECDYIICLGHLGIDEETATNANRSIDLLEKVTGIDVFIDGHSHSTLDEIAAVTNENRTVGETVVTSTGTKLANVGVVTIKGETITTDCIALESYTIAGDEEVAARAAEINAEIDAEYGVVFAKSEVLLNGERAPGNRTEETNLGDLITDAILWYATKDGEDLGVAAENVVAITNGGGIRAAIEAGDITKKDVNTVLPFGNTVAYITVTGAALLEALEASTFCTPTAVGGFPQVAGIAFTIDVGETYDQGDVYPGSEYHKPNSINRVTINSVNGQDFDPEADYVVVTNDFLAAGGDTYYAFSVAENIVDSGAAMDEVLMLYITEVLEGTVTAEKYGEPQGRITTVGEPPAAEPEEPTEEPTALTFSDVTEDNWHYEFVMKMAESGFVGGYADGTFLPGGNVKWSEALAMVMRFAGYEEQAAVEGGTWASGWIAKAQEDGLVEGDVDQNAFITRAELCELVAKAMEVAPSESESAFADTDNAYVQALVELEVIGGMPDGTFQPDGELTRAQLCKILATFPQLPAVGEAA